MPKLMVGRAPQLAELHRTLDIAAAGNSRLVLIGGDAGGGKTTLVQAFGREAIDRPATVELGECLPLEGLAYAPVSRLLRGLIDTYSAGRVLDWAGAARVGLSAVLPDLVPAPEATDTMRLQLYEAVTQVIERASRDRPLILIIEDLHWADQPTRQLLNFVARALTDSPVMIIMTYRSDELTRRHPVRPFLAELARLPQLRRIDLPRLNRPETVELLTDLIGREPSSSMIDVITARSEGVPYFIEELARAAVDCRDCLPDNLRDALSVRIQGLSEETQSLLRVLAVAGQRVDHDILEAVAGQETGAADLDHRLREAIDAQVLRVDATGYVFGHALLQETVNEDILPGQRARLHGRYATVIEELPRLSELVRARELARHWFEAHEQHQAFRWAYRAARSDDVAAHDSLLMYERVLELWDRVPDPAGFAGPRAEVLQRAAEAARAAIDPERALALIKESVAETAPDDHERLAERLIYRSRQLTTLMRSGAVIDAERALALLPADPPTEVRAEVLERLSVCLMLEQGRAAEALRRSRELIETGIALGSRRLEASGRNWAGSVMVALGDEEAGLAELRRAEPLSQGDADSMIRYFVNLSDAQYWAGRFTAAVATARAGLEAAEPLGLDRTMGVMLAGNAAVALLALGDWPEAQRLIDQALRLDPPAKHGAHLRLLRGWVSLWTGDLDGAEQILIEYRSLIINDVPSPQYAIMAIGLEIWLGLWRDDPERAWGGAQFLFQNWDRLHASMVFEPLAAAARAARLLDGGEGERTAAIRRHLAHSVRTTLGRHWTPTIEAELAGTTEAWRTAWQDTESCGGQATIRPYAGLRFAERLIADHDHDHEVAGVITTALAAADHLGATRLSVPLRDLAGRAGVALEAPEPVAAAPDPAGPLSSLTPREREVLTLVAQGRTNGEIARELVISTKTASVHVSNILTKFGVTNRGEAAALAHHHTR
ncbi:helix-turn-helix transcriptional regulator [Microlunatus speluncae]|uniref:helix-turn-helix transcriptional regulator n=1 Tax=Microlunatus speluncae TaxID=2594267 RepID=UPI0012662715|nr:LuxR family transcriptional regulator [Microlunatus speluncae]